jgi:hypothetical protein
MRKAKVFLTGGKEYVANPFSEGFESVRKTTSSGKFVAGVRELSTARVLLNGVDCLFGKVKPGDDSLCRGPALLVHVNAHGDGAVVPSIDHEFTGALNISEVE